MGSASLDWFYVLSLCHHPLSILLEVHMISAVFFDDDLFGRFTLV